MPGSHASIGERKIVTALAATIQLLIDTPEARDAWIERPGVDQSAAIIADITALTERIEKLNKGINQADVDYYSHGALEQDAQRHSAIVATLKRQIAAAQAEITTLQNRLHEEERNGQREQRINDIAANGLHYLLLDDVRTANAWLRDRFVLRVERRKVQEIEIVF